MGEPTSLDKTKGAESPTTARPLDFDDDQQETGVVSVDGPSAVGSEQRAAQRTPGPVRFAEHEEEQAPPKPPRPDDGLMQAHNTLIEAFPTIDPKVIKAVLVASGGQVEPAFNALLGMSDPSFQEEAPPTPPPRPTAQQRQMEQDELYARQLSEHYNYTNRGPPNQPGQPYGGQGFQQGQGQGQGDREHSFFDDDLPEIRENLRQGFLNTQTKVNKWISDFRKRIDGDEDEVNPIPGQGAPPRQNFGGSQSEQLWGIQREAELQRGRRSTDRERYDADPQVLSDNFTELELRDEEDIPPPKPVRPQANPDLFKPTPNPPQSGPVDEIDAAYGRTGSNVKGTAPTLQSTPASAKSNKWQPLKSVAPVVDADDDHDPFALGDSDDDKTKDVRADDTERLKEQAKQTETAPPPKLQEADRAGDEGTRDKETEQLLTSAPGPAKTT